MRTYTSEDIKRLQEQTKLRKKRQKEKRYKAYQKTYQRKYRQLSIEDKQTAQNGSNTPQIAFSYYIYHNYIERDTNEEQLYQTREELEQAFPNHIRWDKWQELVNKTKEEINQSILNKYKTDERKETSIPI